MKFLHTENLFLQPLYDFVSFINIDKDSSRVFTLHDEGWASLNSLQDFGSLIHQITIGDKGWHCVDLFISILL